MRSKSTTSEKRPLKTVERVISKAGIGSRTEARGWIGEGRVAVNGRVVTDPDTWIDLERDQVTFDQKPLRQSQPVYLLLHKPAGYLTTYRDPEGRPTVYDLLEDNEQYLFPVGRLDLETSGLLILTNDSQFAERLTNPDFKVPKTYKMTASCALGDAAIDTLRHGVQLKDGPTRPAVIKVVEIAPKTILELTITEGRNRQIRRMIEAVGSEVVELARLAIGPVKIGQLAAGKSRALTAAEVESLGGGRRAKVLPGGRKTRF